MIIQWYRVAVGRSGRHAQRLAQHFKKYRTSHLAHLASWA